MRQCRVRRHLSSRWLLSLCGRNECVEKEQNDVPFDATDSLINYARSGYLLKFEPDENIPMRSQSVYINLDAQYFFGMVALFTENKQAKTNERSNNRIEKETRTMVIFEFVLRSVLSTCDLRKRKVNYANWMMKRSELTVCCGDEFVVKLPARLAVVALFCKCW